MDLRTASRLWVAAVAVLLLGTACSNVPGIGSKAAASPAPSGSPVGSPLARASGALDAQVPMPAGFPADMPIYANSRLTAAASFTSTDEVAWGMEWESADATTKVQASFPKQFNQGDWTLNVTSNAPGAFAATLTRKSNSRVTGTLAIDNDVAVTKILLSLVSPP
ncbi:MAG: hypothetical protein E6I61_01990 [Chloroflexi bacterium]|nr:MAG: hypothetical protein E6I61_01990 [Chloroflexota bacterium]TME53303.1 MAG: hypothetical protein E6I53_03770 [Chloroflexota bacterium]